MVPIVSGSMQGNGCWPPLVQSNHSLNQKQLAGGVQRGSGMGIGWPATGCGRWPLPQAGGRIGAGSQMNGLGLAIGGSAGGFVHGMWKPPTPWLSNTTSHRTCQSSHSCSGQVVPSHGTPTPPNTAPKMAVQAAWVMS
jgi:hypothetical protein